MMDSVNVSVKYQKSKGGQFNWKFEDNQFTFTEDAKLQRAVRRQVAFHVIDYFDNSRASYSNYYFPVYITFLFSQKNKNFYLPITVKIVGEGDILSSMKKFGAMARKLMNLGGKYEREISYQRRLFEIAEFLLPRDRAENWLSCAEEYYEDYAKRTSQRRADLKLSWEVVELAIARIWKPLAVFIGVPKLWDVIGKLSGK